MKTKNGRKMSYTGEVQVARSHYSKDGINSLRVTSITQQLREVARFQPQSVLEIGVGLGLVKSFLSYYPDVEHRTIDIDPELEPDHVGSVLEMPFDDKSFDLTLCCQVLEHLPFDTFVPALSEIRRVTRERVVLSLPDVRRHLGVSIKVPKNHEKISLEINIDKPSLGHMEFDGQHYWEIGYKGTRGRQVKEAIKVAGYKIVKNYRLDGHTWHCFFILEPL